MGSCQEYNMKLQESKHCLIPSLPLLFIHQRATTLFLALLPSTLLGRCQQYFAKHVLESVSIRSKQGAASNKEKPC